MQINLIHYSFFIILLIFFFGNYFALSKNLNFPKLIVYKKVYFLFNILFLNLIAYFLFTNIEEISLIYNYFFIFDSHNYDVIAIASIFFLIFLIQTNKVYEYLKLYNYEFIIILICAFFSFLLLITCMEFISFYFVLETQSISFYVLVCITLYNRNSLNSAFKYLIIGSLSSIFLLLGFSFIYAVSGHTMFEDIKLFLILSNDLSLLFYIGIFFILISFCIKLYIVPFHFWILDIYENIPISLICFFSSISFFSFFTVFINWYYWLFNNCFFVDYIILLFSIFSMLFGAINGIFENNLKRIFAYSSIGNIGYQLLFFILNKDTEAIEYMFSYSLNILLGLFSVSILLDNINITGLFFKNKLIAFSLLLFLFISSGTPPSILSIMKLIVLSDLNNFFNNFLQLLLLLFSFISCFYYIRLIKQIVFTLPTDNYFIKEFSIMNIFFINILILLNLILLFDLWDIVDFFLI
jgi:NADH-quinone oxidoreductase subunit N